MTNRNAATVDIDLGRIQIQEAIIGHTNHRKGFVDLVKVHIAGGDACPVHGQGDGFGWGRGEPFRGLLSVGVAQYSGQGLEPSGLGFTVGHEDHRRCPVVQVRGVGSGNRSFFFEDRFETRDLFKIHFGIVFVFGDRCGAAFRSWDTHHRQFGGEFALLPSGCRPLVGFDGIGILVSPGNLHIACAQFRGVTHVVLVINIPKAVLKDAVHQLGMTELVPIASPIQIIRDLAHALHAAGNDYAVLPQFNGLGTQHDGLHARCTDLVDGGEGGGFGDACPHGGLGCRRLPQASTDDIPHVNLVNAYDARCSVVYETGFFQSGCNGDTAQGSGRKTGQRTAHASNGGTGDGNQAGVVGGKGAWHEFIVKW